MSVKSTVVITRKEAEDFYIQLKTQLDGNWLIKNDVWLEDELERMNDILHGGECFENYLIKD
jgi:hypothetical protein